MTNAALSIRPPRPDTNRLRELFDAKKVPSELREQRQWLVWRYEWRDDTWTKVPYSALTQEHASTTDAVTWSRFEDAVAAWCASERYDGIGFVFTADDPYCGIDLDDCVDESGEMSLAAQEIVRDFSTYAETSPSHSGAKLITKASKPTKRCTSTAIAGIGKIEIYESGRYFTVTTMCLDEAPHVVTSGQPQLEALCKRLWASAPRTKAHLNNSLCGGGFGGTDDQLIDAASNAANGAKFRALWSGDTTGYGNDDSSADFALCLILAFWCGRDASRIDRLFRQSGLMRDKWDRPTAGTSYGALTIQKAITECREVFQPARSTLCGDAHKEGKGCSPALPQILLGTDEHRVVDEAIHALNADTDLYQRGGRLVRCVTIQEATDRIARSKDVPVIRPVPLPNLRDRMTSVAVLLGPDKKGDIVQKHPPSWLISAIDSRGEWEGIRPLTGISDAPVLRADGSIAQQPGYDSATGVLLVPTETFPEIDPAVDIDDAQAALDTLLEVVADFEFTDESHRAAWVAGLLTPLARFAFEGCAPLFLVDANIRGAGKSLLVQTFSHIVTGRCLSANGYVHDSDEMRKKITAIALAGDQMVLLDNIAGAFGNAELDRALTASRWNDRILGGNEQADLRLHTTWYATGNNVQIAADTIRRVVHIRLQVLHEQPEMRTGFRHPNLTEWIVENRPRLLSAALTILAAYSQAGRPSQGLSPFGGFEEWSSLVREAVVWVGLPDPCSTRLELAEAADTSTAPLRRLFAAWEQYDSSQSGVVVSRMISELYPRDKTQQPMAEPAVEMRAAIEELISCQPDKTPCSRRLGAKLRSAKHRVIDGRYLDTDKTQRRNGALWLLLRVEERHEA